MSDAKDKGTPEDKAAKTQENREKFEQKAKVVFAKANEVWGKISPFAHKGLDAGKALIQQIKDQKAKATAAKKPDQAAADKKNEPPKA